MTTANLAPHYQDECPYDGFGCTVCNPGPTAVCAAADAAETAAALVELAEAARAEYELRIRLDRVYEALGRIPEDELTEEDDLWLPRIYMAWAAAWERLAQLRSASSDRRPDR